MKLLGIGWKVRLSFFILALSFFSAGATAADEGEVTYKAKCAMCHGQDGSGDTAMGKKLKVRDLRSAEVQSQTDAQLTDIINKGKSPMPGYEKQLDKEKIKQVLAYLRELGKKK